MCSGTESVSSEPVSLCPCAPVWHGTREGDLCYYDSTRPWQKLQYSPGSKHPFLWFSLPPQATSAFGGNDKLLYILLAAEPPVIQTTGRTKEFSLSAGDLEAQNQVQVLPEVEILLDEEDLARVCYFCLSLTRKEVLGLNVSAMDHYISA